MGMTCGYCAHFPKCSQFVGAEEGWTKCDWHPSRFCPVPLPDPGDIPAWNTRIRARPEMVAAIKTDLDLAFADMLREPDEAIKNFYKILFGLWKERLTKATDPNHRDYYRTAMRMYLASIKGDKETMKEIWDDSINTLLGEE